MRQKLSAANASPAFLLLALLLATLACARGTPPAATPPALPPPEGMVTATAVPLGGSAAELSTPVAAGGAFAPYLPAEVESAEAVPAYRLHLGKVSNPDALAALNQAQQDALVARGFVVLPTRYPSFNALYREAGEQDLPLFVTVDAAAHALDLVADVAWRRAERAYLAADLAALSEALVDATLGQWESAADPATEEAAWHNLAFFAVGQQLQNPQAAIPPPVADVVQEELTLVAQGGTFLSPLFGSSRNYGTLQPPPAYAADPALAAYYRALAWYAHPFSLEGEELRATRRVARQLLLLAGALRQTENVSRWQRLYGPLAYFHGSAAAWSVDGVGAAASAVYGEIPSPAALPEREPLDDFIATLQAYPQPATFAPPAAPAFRLLPAPALPDRAWLDTFVFNQVGGYTGRDRSLPSTLVETAVGPVRGLPRVLDLAAAQGSPAATGRLEAAGDTAYTGYETQLAAARARLESLEVETWARSWAGGWHYSLQPLLLAPAPMRYLDAAAWEAKALNSWYGAWVRLQSDTVLGPRPVAPEVAASTRSGYVEPYPAVYGRLAALARQLHGGLDQYDVLDGEAGEKLLRLERLLLAFQTITAKERREEALTADELLVLRQAGARLENLLTFAPEAGTTVPLTEASVRRIVDVYPGPTGDEWLQAGVGGVWPLYVLVPEQGRLLLTVGGVYAGYELRVEREEKWVPGTWDVGIDDVAPARWAEELLVP